MPPHRRSSHGAPVTESPDPSLSIGARAPWLMFYKLPWGFLRQLRAHPFLPCCMHSAWDYIPRLQLLPQTMKSRRDDSHLTNPRTPRKIQIKMGRMHCSDLLAASFVCAGCRLVKGRRKKKKSQRGSCYKTARPLCVMCVSSGLQR